VSVQNYVVQLQIPMCHMVIVQVLNGIYVLLHAERKILIKEGGSRRNVVSNSL